MEKQRDYNVHQKCAAIWLKDATTFFCDTLIEMIHILLDRANREWSASFNRTQFDCMFY